MTIKPPVAVLTSLQRVRAELRGDAEAAVNEARRAVEQAEQAWTEARARLSKLGVAEQRDAAKVLAGALQRAEACRVALSRARVEASAKVTARFAEVVQARVKRDAVEETWRSARAEERAVERMVERREADADEARQRAEDEDNDERGQRR